MGVNLHDLKMMFEFRYAPSIFWRNDGPWISAIKQFSGFFFPRTFADIELICGMLVNHHDLQIKLEFRCTALIFREIMCLTLSKFHRWNSFPDFFPHLCRYCADFWHASQSPAFLKAMHTKTDTFLTS